MLGDKHFFEIPIYYCNEQEYYEHVTKEIKAEFDSVRSQYDTVYKSAGKTTMATDGEIQESVVRNLNKVSWQYNLIIGFIRLFVLGDQMRGEYYFVENKRMSVEVKNKRIRWMGKFFPEFTIKNNSNQEIIDKFIKEIEDGKNHLINTMKLSKKFGFGKIYIDTECFLNIAKFVDWQLLMKNHPGWKT